MNFIDTHAHLYLDDFRTDIDDVIKRALNAGVSKFVLPNIDASSIAAMHNLADRYPGKCFPLMGLHPTSVRADFLVELETILNRLAAYPYYAIGEIGIDLYWDKTYKNEQINVFTLQLDYAEKNNLPVVIHARESFKEIMDIVKMPKYAGIKGIFHAFTGDAHLAKEIIQLGYKLGIGGILTFKNSGLAETIRSVDLEHIVLETDSPYLAPFPYRGKRNESSYIRYVAEILAKIKGVSIEEVASTSTRNAEQIFSI
jgi:TatD DNase family protein